ncbi:MAG: CcmD family protein, partial [Gemmatimonadales bacterium]|nr:CcmD family protein [Gemmatimonadales bacterium]
AQSLKPYWHVFIAYSVVILAVLGWVISMSRRLARLEAQLSD